MEGILSGPLVTAPIPISHQALYMVPMDTSALPYECLIATLSNREGRTEMDLKLENEELWALINDAICLLETKEEEPGVAALA